MLIGIHALIVFTFVKGQNKLEIKLHNMHPTHAVKSENNILRQFVISKKSYIQQWHFKQLIKQQLK